LISINNSSSVADLFRQDQPYQHCQSAVNKAHFIPAFADHSTLNILGLTETWIHPEDSATPAALSNNFSFSHTRRQSNNF